MSVLDRFAPVLAQPDPQLEHAGANLLVAPGEVSDSQAQTGDVFGRKWANVPKSGQAFEQYMAYDRRRYLELYGFDSEQALAAHLRDCRFVIDCGAGMAGKAAWFASLSPDTTVIAADISDSIVDAARRYADEFDNLLFLRCDISHMPYFADGAFDYVNCDQVLHHTQDPARCLAELVRITRPGRQIACYVYRRKALPRELLDEHFRSLSPGLSEEDLVALAGQLTELGRMLSELEIELDFPAIPLLGIEGGREDLQRFIYWNFLKCYWNPELGQHMSMITNYDWYAPSQAARYSEPEFRGMLAEHDLDIDTFHVEQACLSGRMRRPQGAKRQA